MDHTVKNSVFGTKQVKPTCCLRICPSLPLPPIFCRVLMRTLSWLLKVLVSSTNPSSWFALRCAAASSILFNDREWRSEIRDTLSLKVLRLSWMELICKAENHWNVRTANALRKSIYLGIKRGHVIASLSSGERNTASVVDVSHFIPVILLGIWVGAAALIASCVIPGTLGWVWWSFANNPAGIRERKDLLCRRLHL